MTGFVVNPASAGGQTGRLWPRIAALLPEYFPRFEARLTRAPGDGTRMACELLHAGAECIVAVGGDGTLNEVVNSSCQRVGVLPVGSSGDFARMLGMPRDWKLALPWLAEATPRAMDLGLATFATGTGATHSHYFANMASFGLGGSVARRRHMPYLMAAMAEVPRTEPAVFDFVLDGMALRLRALHVAVGNGRYQGKGMNVCPHAQLDDGMLDVTIIEPLALLEIAREVNRIYSGAILEHPKVHPHLVRTLSATASAPVAVELDGEPVGFLPLEIEVVPGAVQVLVADR